MSTKSSIAYDDNYHLYDELMDGGVYLEIRNAQDASIEVLEGRVVVRVRLPKALLDRLKLDDEQLVESSGMFDVDATMNRIHDAKKSARKSAKKNAKKNAKK